jgi:hypothetical protein
MRPTEIFRRAAAAQAEAPRLGKPADEGTAALTEQVFPFSIVRGTEYYIEKVAQEINGTYERGWFDACAVMIRRLLETLIIEVYEAYGISHNIKNSAGDFRVLDNLIDIIVKETTFNLSRNSKRALPKLKDVGNLSAHSRRFLAHVSDIDRNREDLRVVIQELVHLARLKKLHP